MSRKYNRLVPLFFTLSMLLAIFFISESPRTSSLPSVATSNTKSSELGYSSYSPNGIEGGAIVPASCELGVEHYAGQCSFPQYMYVCATNNNSCRLTDSQYTNDNVGIYKCTYDQVVYYSGQTTGICYTTKASCDTACGGVPPPPPFDYSLSNSGTSYVTKTSGNAFTQNTITKTLTSGTTQSVTLSLSGVPSNVTYSISNSTCSPTCNSVITFTVPPSAPTGTFPITVTGSPLNKQTSFNLVISGNPMTVSCSGSPATPLVGQTITWTATVTGGTPPYIYSWSGTNIPTNPAPNTNPFSISYSTIGQKIAIATVTDADALVTACDGIGGHPAPGSVYVNFNPLLEEF